MFENMCLSGCSHTSAFVVLCQSYISNNHFTGVSNYLSKPKNNSQLKKILIYTNPDCVLTVGLYNKKYLHLVKQT